MNAQGESQIWNKLLQSVEKRLNPQILNTWFRTIEFEGCDHHERRLHLRAPSKINFDWVNNQYSEVMQQSLKDVDLSDYRLDWSYDETETEQNNEKSANAFDFEDEDDEDDNEINFQLSPPAQSNPPTNLLSLIETVEADGLKKSAPTFVDIEPLELSLNQKYSFNTFVVG